MSKNATLRSLQTRLICRNSRARFPSRFCRSEAKAAQSCPGFFWTVPTYPSRGSSKAKAKTAAFSERGSGGMSERAGREPRLRRSARKLGEGSPPHRSPHAAPRASSVRSAPRFLADVTCELAALVLTDPFACQRRVALFPYGTERGFRRGPENRGFAAAPARTRCTRARAWFPGPSAVTLFPAPPGPVPFPSCSPLISPN